MPIDNTRQKQIVERQDDEANLSRGREWRKFENNVHSEKPCMGNSSYWGSLIESIALNILLLHLYYLPTVSKELSPNNFSSAHTMSIYLSEPYSFHSGDATDYRIS